MLRIAGISLLVFGLIIASFGGYFGTLGESYDFMPLLLFGAVMIGAGAVLSAYSFMLHHHKKTEKL